MKAHSYEEIRDAVIDILLGKERVEYPPEQFAHLALGVDEVFHRREGRQWQGHGGRAPKNPHDEELCRDVFWDLFRQGAITLGLNSSNPNYPFFRLSHFGKNTLASQSPWRFHDTSSYLTLVRNAVPDVSDAAIAYLDEAVAAFYANCLLASCVMIGVAAEVEFAKVIQSAVDNQKYKDKFSSANSEKFISGKIKKFQAALNEVKSELPRDAIEDLDKNFLMIQSILRVARNEAGHPSNETPSRENVYVYLQLFIPFARQLMKLRHAFKQ